MGTLVWYLLRPVGQITADRGSAPGMERSRGGFGRKHPLEPGSGLESDSAKRLEQNHVPFPVTSEYEGDADPSHPHGARGLTERKDCYGWRSARDPGRVNSFQASVA